MDDVGQGNAALGSDVWNSENHGVPTDDSKL